MLNSFPPLNIELVSHTHDSELELRSPDFQSWTLSSALLIYMGRWYQESCSTLKNAVDPIMCSKGVYQICSPHSANLEQDSECNV